MMQSSTQKSKKSIDDVILSLRDNFLVEREEDMAVFIGINISRSKDGSKEIITMTHTGLIDRILQAMDMLDSNVKYTPADKDPLHKDLMGEPCCEAWKYRSIFGMMLYLAGSTLLNIIYAVHQCARFSHNPKKSYEVGVKHIARYLKGTR